MTPCLSGTVAGAALLAVVVGASRVCFPQLWRPRRRRWTNETTPSAPHPLDVPTFTRDQAEAISRGLRFAGLTPDLPAGAEQAAADLAAEMPVTIPEAAARLVDAMPRPRPPRSALRLQPGHQVVLSCPEFLAIRQPGAAVVEVWDPDGELHYGDLPAFGHVDSEMAGTPHLGSVVCQAVVDAWNAGAAAGRRAGDAAARQEILGSLCKGPLD